MPVSTSVITLIAKTRCARRHIGAKRLICLPRAIGSSATATWGARLAFAAVLVFAIEPQGGVRPEEREDADQQRDHELRRDPHVRIAAEVVRVRMRLESDKPCRRAGVALLAGSQPVVRMHRRGRIAHAPHVMVRVAIEAFRRMAVSERRHLPMVGVGIAFQVLLVAVAAPIDDVHPLRFAARSLDVVVRVATCTGRAVPAFRDLRRVHGGRVLLRRVAMAVAAFHLALYALFVRHLGDVLVTCRARQRPVLALREAVDRHMERSWLTVGTRHGEAFVAMTRKAGRVVQRLRRVLGLRLAGE